MQAKEVADSSVTRIVEEIVKCALSGRCVDPLLQSAVGEITVVVDERSPAWHHIETSISIALDSGSQRPESALRVAKKWSRIVSNDVGNTVVHPSFDGIGVVQTRNRGWDKPLRTPPLGSIKPNLL